MAVPMTFATQGRIEGLLDPAILDRFLSLDQGGKCNAEYVWLGGTGADLRSKTKTLDKAPDSLKDLPTWNFDGSSTNQAPGVLLVAVMEAAGTLAACGCIDRKPEHACWWPLPCSAAGPRSAGARVGHLCSCAPIWYHCSLPEKSPRSPDYMALSVFSFRLQSSGCRELPLCRIAQHCSARKLWALSLYPGLAACDCLCGSPASRHCPANSEIRVAGRS